MKDGFSDDEATRARITSVLWNDLPQKKKLDIERVLDTVFEFNRLVLPQSRSTCRVVNFGDTSVMDALTVGCKQVIQAQLIRPQLLFAKRAELGLLNILHRSKARVDTREIVERSDALSVNELDRMREEADKRYG